MKRSPFGPGSAFSLEAKLAYAGNPLTPPAVLEILAMDENWAVRRRVASHPGISQTTCLILARDTSPEVRAELAMNPSIPEEVAKILASDKEFLVRMALSRNRNLSSELLLRLAKDQNPSVREALSGREPLGLDLARELAKDPSMSVRLRVYRNPTTPPDVVLEGLLAMDPLQAVEVMELIKPLPNLVQHGLARKGSPLVRAALAKASWVDREVWELLTRDPERFVQESALQNPIYRK